MHSMPMKTPYTLRLQGRDYRVRAAAAADATIAAQRERLFDEQGRRRDVAATP